MANESLEYDGPNPKREGIRESRTSNQNGINQKSPKHTLSMSGEQYSNVPNLAAPFSAVEKVLQPKSVSFKFPESLSNMLSSFVECSHVQRGGNRHKRTKEFMSEQSMTKVGLCGNNSKTHCLTTKRSEGL